MSGITILSKQPPGGRCSLYMRYAETLHEKLGLGVEVRFCDSSAEIPPPRHADRRYPGYPFRRGHRLP